MFENTFTPTFGNLNYMKNTEEDEEEFTERLRKTFYYGKLPGTERPSLPLTDMAVEFFQEAAPRKLGRLDTYFASSSSRNACMTPTSVIAGMMYVKRLRKKQPEYLTQISSSELFLISMMMASKFLYDEGVDEEVFNDEWATSGDMDVEDVNELERDFLTAIDWQLFVRPEEFSEMLDTMEKRIALSQGLQRGWFSYTDLCVLSKDLKFMTWKDLSAELSKVLSVSSLAYLASVLTMIGSTVLGTTASSALVSAGIDMTTASSALVSAGIEILPVYHHWSSIPSLMVDSQLGALSTEEITAMNSANASKSDLDLSRLLGENSLVWSSENSNNQHQSEQNETSELHQGQEGGVKPDTEVAGKEQGTFFNGFLSPFLALVALKDTLVKFAYAVSDKNEFATEPDSSNADDMEDICSDGPCLMDTWPNCWNVSSEIDWTEFKAFHSRCANMKDRRCNRESPYQDSFTEYSRLGHCNRRDKAGTHGSLRDQSGTHGLLTDRPPGYHCCCKRPRNTPYIDFASIDSQLPDLSYGFITSSILITA